MLLFTNRLREQFSFGRKLLWVFISLMMLETILILFALLPVQAWAHLFPDQPRSMLDGPFPTPLAPLITILIYTLPTCFGWFFRDWRYALLIATTPAWLALGVFFAFSTWQLGVFYFLSPEHVSTYLNVLEIFAALGALGWLVRNCYSNKL